MNSEHRILRFQDFSRIAHSTRTRNRGLVLGVTSEVTAYAALEYEWPVLTLAFGAFGILSLMGAFRQHNKLKALHRKVAAKPQILFEKKISPVPSEIANAISDAARKAKKNGSNYVPTVTLPDERRGRKR